MKANRSKTYKITIGIVALFCIGAISIFYSSAHAKKATPITVKLVNNCFHPQTIRLKCIKNCSDTRRNLSTFVYTFYTKKDSITVSVNLPMIDNPIGSPNNNAQYPCNTNNATVKRNLILNSNAKNVVVTASNAGVVNSQYGRKGVSLRKCTIKYSGTGIQSSEQQFPLYYTYNSNMK